MKMLYLFFGLVALLSIACVSQVATSQTSADVVKTRHDSPTPTAAPETAVICLTADTVRLRSGAGTGYAEVMLLTSGQPVTLSGAWVIAPDMGIWQPVEVAGKSGFINKRYLCEVTK